MADYIQIKNGSTDVYPKNIFIETTQVSIPVSQDYFYINEKPGYHLINAMFVSNWGGRWDSIIAIAWTGSDYACFLHQPYATSARTETIMLTWVKT